MTDALQDRLRGGTRWIDPSATAIEAADRIDALEKENLRLHLTAARLRAGIQAFLDGNYPHAERNQKCKHGIWSTDACENCIDEYFEALIAAKIEEGGSPPQDKGVT